VFGGIALAARRSLTAGVAGTASARVSTVATVGPIAGLVTYLAHSPLDWDWQMPAVTLTATALAGAVIAAACSADNEVAQSASAMRGASRRKIQTANAHTAA
jgi:hypothetical protein